MPRNLPVEERHAALHWQADFLGEEVLDVESKEAPAVPATADHVAEFAVEADPFLLLTDSFAVGRVANHEPRRAGGRVHVAHVLAVELDQVADTGHLRVLPGEGECARMHV